MSIPYSLDFNIENLLLFISAITLVIICFKLITTTNLLQLIVLMSAFSLFISICYLCLDAPDVAMTEVALGACLSTCVLLNLVKLTGDEEVENKPKKITLAIILCLIFTVLLSWIALSFPMFGDPDTPLQQHVSKYYLDNTENEIGIPSFVAAILASYRGFDTLGETTVILLAGIAVSLILNKKR